MTTRALTLLTLALAAPLAQAQEPAEPQTPASTPAPDVSSATPDAATQPAAAQASTEVPAGEVKIKESAPVAMKKAGNETLSVDFPDEDIREILRNVADLFDLNLVVPDTLVGKTSVKLRDVTWRQIFQVVLAPVKYTYVEDNNIIKVVSEQSLKEEPTKTELFILNYARAQDILPTIGSLVDGGAGGKIVVDARSNTLVITERPTRLERIRPVIETLDRATDQVMIESKFIEVTDGDVRKLGAKWAGMDELKLGVSPGQSGEFATYDRTSSGETGTTGKDQATTTGTASTGTNNATTSTTTSGVTTTNGVTSSTGGATSTATSGTTGTGTNVSQTAIDALKSLTGTTANERTISTVFTANQFSLVLSALNTLSDTRIVSNPTVVTLNNSDAIINVGEEYPIPQYTYNQEKGTYEVSNFEFRPIGIILKVNPQVNARGFIKLTLEPEVSQRNGETNFGTATIPIIASRKAKTVVSLKDGCTMGIGGMIRKQDTDSVTKVPFLGDIPILGNLFKHKSRNSETTNLLIFITAKVVSAEGASLEDVIDPRQIEQMKMKHDDLPGYRKTDGLLLPPPQAAKPQSSEKKAGWFKRTFGSNK